MRQPKKRFALLLVFPTVIVVAAMLAAAAGAGAASNPVSPTAQGVNSSASSTSDHGVRAPSGACTISEGFDDITNLPGWAMINHSEPLGVSDWFQGNPDVFVAHSGVPDSYIGANFENADGAGTISNWLLTPVVTITNGSQITFWTRAPDPPNLSGRWVPRGVDVLHGHRLRCSGRPDRPFRTPVLRRGRRAGRG